MEDISNIPLENAEIPEEFFVTTMEAYNSLRSLKVRKAPGPDEIPNIVLKQFAFVPIPRPIHIQKPYPWRVFRLLVLVEMQPVRNLWQILNQATRCNLLFTSIQLPTSDHTYSLRSERIVRPTINRTDRFQNFVTVKFRENAQLNS